MDKRVTRQDTAKAQRATVITEEHAEKILLMLLGKYISPTKQTISKLSPQQIVSRREFLDEDNQPLYSVDLVQKLLRDADPGGAGAATGSAGPPRLIDDPVPPSAAVPELPAPTADNSKGQANSSPAGTRLVVVFEAGAPASPLTIKLRLQAEWTLQDVHRQLTEHCALSSSHSFKLQYEHPAGNIDLITDMEDVWDVLQSQPARGRWVFRSIAPRTPLLDRVDPDPRSTISSDTVSRRLSFEGPESDSMRQLTKALRLQQFEQSYTNELKAAVQLAVKPYGEKVGLAGRSPAETFYKALRVMDDLTKALDRLTKLAARREDPTTALQRLHWFIEAVLDLLAADVKVRWQGQDQEEHREASFYSSWLEFRASLFTIIRNVIDYTPDGLMDQLPILVEPNRCASRNDLWVAIEQVQGAAKLLAEMKSVDATAQIEAATVKYLAVSLTPDAIKSISAELALKHRGEASDYYASKQHPPITGYPSKCIKAVMLGRDDFDGPWKADWLTAPSKDPLGPSKEPATPKARHLPNPRADKTTASPDGTTSQRTRVLKRNQQAHVYPYYLKDVTDAGERERQTKAFLANTLVDWKCHKCNNTGHTKEICPQLSKLDANLFERNPQSFFFGVRPPQQVLELGPAAKVMPVLAVAREDVPAPVQRAPFELDQQEWLAFNAWRAAGGAAEEQAAAGPPSGN